MTSGEVRCGAHLWRHAPVLLFIFFFMCDSLLLVRCRTLICTEECLLHPSRNPSLGREGIEAALKEYLGLKKIIWLWKGMAGDDAITNGHVDNLACFVRPGVVALSWTDDVNDPQVITPLHCISIHVHHHVSRPAIPTSCMFDNTCLAIDVPVSTLQTGRTLDTAYGLACVMSHTCIDCLLDCFPRPFKIALDNGAIWQSDDDSSLLILTD